MDRLDRVSEQFRLSVWLVPPFVRMSSLYRDGGKLEHLGYSLPT